MKKSISDFPAMASMARAVLGNHHALLSGLTSDSREIQAGWAFCALLGEQADGNRYIPDAIRRGATCIVCEGDVGPAIVQAHPDICFIGTPVILEFMAALSAWLFETASSSLITIGITGTNGKTTIAAMLNQALQRSGHETVFIGTTGFEVAGRHYPTDFTTPPSYVIHRLIREGLDTGAAYLVMEVSSHALKLKRVWGLQFDAVVFTNLTHEHKEIHPDMEDYFQTKFQLFGMLKPGAFGVVNKDDPYGARIVREYRGEGVIHDYGKQAGRVRLDSVAIQKPMHRQQIGLTISDETLIVDSCLPGEYNAYNVAAAAGVLLDLGWRAPDVVSALSSFTGVDGRFNRYRVGTIDAIVDFAHTPDGLEKVLAAARSLMEKNSRLITLFGCPGSRDSSKRPMMGRVASERSDWVIVTTDDIHYEEPKDIAENIVAGIAKENFEVILDRREAIRAALKLARAGDYVLLAGRGHERFQYVGDRKVPFVDGEVLAEEAKRLGMEITRL